AWLQAALFCSRYSISSCLLERHHLTSNLPQSAASADLKLRSIEKGCIATLISRTQVTSEITHGEYKGASQKDLMETVVSGHAGVACAAPGSWVNNEGWRLQRSDFCTIFA